MLMTLGQLKFSALAITATILELYQQHGLTVPEISARTGISESTIHQVLAVYLKSA